MNRVWLACVLAVVFAAATGFIAIRSGGRAAPTTNLAISKAVAKVNYYDVRGTTLEELRQDVFSRGPYDKEANTRFAGWAEWRIQWWFDRREVAGGCAVANASTETHIEYTLPRWVDEDAAPPELRASWKRFIDALTEHEEGHGRLARELAEQIEFAIRSLPPEPTCEELDRKVNELANRLIREDKTQEAYDRETGHGETQGAAFPSILVHATSKTAAVSE